MITQPEDTVRERIQAILDALTKDEQYDDEIGFRYWQIGDEKINSGVCTNSARMIVDQFPGSIVYGYPLDPHKHENCVAAWCLGHDFALIYERFLVDWWGAHVEGTSSEIYDLMDPDDADYVARLYLPRQQWRHVYTSP